MTIKNKACAFHQLDFINSLILQALFCKICMGVGIQHRMPKNSLTGLAKHRIKASKKKRDQV